VSFLGTELAGFTHRGLFPGSGQELSALHDPCLSTMRETGGQEPMIGP